MVDSSTVMPALDQMLPELTYLGDVALTVPVALTCAIWLALSDRRLAFLWAACLLAGMVLVGVTKVLFAASQVEIEPIGFRMISGHAMLSTAVWTVAATLLCWGCPHGRIFGTIVGLFVGAATGAAHVLDHSHTVIEALIGWLVGAIVAASFLRRCREAGLTPVRPIAAATALPLVSSFAYGRTTPLETMIDKYSPVLIAHLRGSLLPRLHGSPTRGSSVSHSYVSRFT
jgi:membrane-associated phospholipid phosphatase